MRKEIEVIDADFLEAATYYSSRAFGGDKSALFTELKRRYEDDENLDSMVYILARHRINNPPPLPKEFVLAPINPPVHLNLDLPRKIMRWLDGSQRKTPNQLINDLTEQQTSVPEWLHTDSCMQDTDRVMSLNNRCLLVYKAILYDYLNVSDPTSLTGSEPDSLHGVLLPPPGPPCTCLSELEDDAYGPGGPMSGRQRPPPCELHKPQ